MRDSPVNIVIGGEAGQGLVTVGMLLSKALVRHGYRIVVTQGYQSRIRGGHNTYSIRVGASELAAPQESIDLLVALTEETVSLHGDGLVPDGLIVSDAKFKHHVEGSFKIPYDELAPKRSENIAALGVVAQLIGLDEERIANMLQQVFGKKGEDVVSQNREALANAYRWSQGQKHSFVGLPKTDHSIDRLMMNGNEAIVLGALSAGIRFYAFYPMTPSTSVGLGLVAQAKRMGVVVEQAEDEIAAINMAIGASYAGAPSMVATSGGGFALMVEGVSLAAMTETPVVIVDAQRPGPATGVPTRTEQADLEFILHSGHGEFPRAIFAPGNVEECFHLTRKAFELAEISQGPAFILTDQFLADSYRAVEPFSLDDLEPVRVGADPDNIEEPYLRYRLTGNGISPRLVPGKSRHLVVVDSDEHTEDGHLTEDLGMRKAMAEKRLRKIDILNREALSPRHIGDADPDLLLVCWGSTVGSVEEAVGQLRSEGKRAALLHFSQVWPLIPDRFLKYLETASDVIMVEGNATAQFARLIRRETGFEIPKRILRYDGLPITPEYIMRRIHG